MRLLILFAALAPAAWGQPPASSADLYRRTHDALFASFLPVTELRNDPKLTQLLVAAGDGIWAGAAQSPQFRQLLAPFTNLGGFGPACGMDTLVRAAQTTVFADLAPAEREHALMLIQRCPENEPRRLAANVRNFYTVQ